MAPLPHIVGQLRSRIEMAAPGGRDNGGSALKKEVGAREDHGETGSLNKRKMIVYPIAALLSALMMFSGLLVRLSIDDAHRVGVPSASSRTDPSDNYVYFSLLKQGVSACQRQTAPFVEPIQGNRLACTYIGGIALGNALWRVADAIAPSKRIAVSVLLILNTTVLSLAFLWALSGILGRSFSLMPATAIAAVMLFTIDNFGLSFYARELNLHFRDVLSLEPGFARLVNPSLFWALGWATVALIVSQIRRPSALGLAALFFVSLLSGLSGLAVSAAIGLGCGLFGVWYLARERKPPWPAIVSSIGLAIGIAFAVANLREFYATELGAGLNHGQSGALKMNWAMLWFAVPILLGKIVFDNAPQNILLKCLLAAAAFIGLICESFELGNRLWLRGAGAIAFLVCAAWLWVRIEVFFRNRPAAVSWASIPLRKYPGAGRLLSIAVVFLLLPIAIAIARPPGLDKARWFIDRDKQEVLSWLDARSDRMTRIASTSIEDSFLLDFYTAGAPYVPLYGMTVLPIDVQLGRYFHILNLIKEGDAKLARIAAVSKATLGNFNEELKAGFSSPPDRDFYESIVFYNVLLYYPYDSRTLAFFRGDRPDEGFLKRLDEIKAGASVSRPEFAYLILRRDEHLKDEGAFETVFQNNSYTILRPKH